MKELRYILACFNCGCLSLNTTAKKSAQQSDSILTKAHPILAIENEAVSHIIDQSPQLRSMIYATTKNPVKKLRGPSKVIFEQSLSNIYGQFHTKKNEDICTNTN